LRVGNFFFCHNAIARGCFDADENLSKIESPRLGLLLVRLQLRIVLLTVDMSPRRNSEKSISPIN